MASIDRAEERLRQIEQSNTPHLLIGSRFSGWERHFVGVDDELAGVIAVERLISQCRKRIAHILGLQASTVLDRLEGCRKALSKAGLTMQEGYVAAGKAVDDEADASGYAAINRLLALPERPDAAFCYNDPVVLGFIKAILEKGRDIPGDRSIVGCGTMTSAGLFRVPLSSVDQQSNEFGRRS